MMVERIINHRKKIFKESLLDIVLGHYGKFQKENSTNDDISTFNPYQQNQWHEKFHLHNVPHIPKQELSKQPKMNRTETISEFIDKYDTKH